MHDRSMMLIAALLVLAVAAPAAAHRSGIAVGLSLDGIVPLDSDIYGATMLDNDWAKTMSGITYSYDSQGASYYGPNRESLVLGPALQFKYISRIGLGFEISERFSWLYFQPDSEVDVGFSQLVLPTLITLKYQMFLGERDQIRPFVGVGAGAYYVQSVISGPDLQDRQLDPGAAAGERDYLYQSQRFERSGWAAGYHGLIGLDYFVTRRVGLSAALSYETCRWTGVEAELIDDGDGTWHWQEYDLDGDLGGIGLRLGLTSNF
ncbi:MAG: hypothetical protein P9M14_08505 [Candidatus Alcyoniella australis]|nr:hypothetical protein [Candidatus Alcyoniella australis]